MADATERFTVRFWGVRGSLPTPNAATRRYGGNTPCVELRCNSHLIILDAGTGIRALGASLVMDAPIDADIIVSETRFDHMCGLPFFGPGYNPANMFNVWTGHHGSLGSVQRELMNMMTSPLFPIPLSSIGALKFYRDFLAGSAFSMRPGLEVRTTPLDHPHGATGYRFDYGGHSLCYISSTQHRPGKQNQAILKLIAGADVVIYDSYYSDQEYSPEFCGGHSTWEEGVRLCRAAGARRLIAFQHHPAHDDAFLDEMQQGLDQALPGSLVAAEGLVIDL